jgi:iron complex transport system substrate-binding protein
MNKKSIKITGIIVILAMLSIAVVVAGCTTQQTATPTPTPSSTTNATATPSSTTFVVTDAAGRAVTIPTNVTRVTSIHPTESYILYRLAPQKTAGVDNFFKGEVNNVTWNPSDVAYINSLPTVPAFPLNPTKEQILATNPGVLLTLTKDPQLSTWYTLGIPVFEDNKDNLTYTEQSLRNIGEIVGNTALANQMAEFWHDTIANVTSQTSQQTTHPKVLYDNGKYNSTTINIPGNQTIFASEISLAGGINFYDNSNPSSNQLPAGQSPSSESIPTDISYVYAWNPDVIICTSNATASYIMAPGSPYQDLNAVKNGHVYTVPKYESMDNIYALMGFEWLSTVMYPGQVHLDFVNDTKAFYQLYQNDSISTALVNTPSP